MYGGVVLLVNHNASFIFELILIACEFLFDELAKYLETHLIETKAHWLRLNFTRIYQNIFQNNELQKLQKWCNDIVAKYPDKIFESENFSSLQENVLVSLISRDDLQMEKIKIWNLVIKWGIAQNPGLVSNPKNWSNETFLSLKTTLQNILPHIRYFQMSSDDINNNVQQYQQILEKDLWNDITKKLMSADRQVSSKILPPRVILAPILPIRNTEPVINGAHAAEIASWVDKKADIYSVTDNPYEFKLLLRGTRDGFTKDSFWRLCVKQTHLVVVMKVKGTDEILGGYNPIGWDKPTGNRFYKYCNDSFIFSLKNCTIQNSILSRVKKPEFAIDCSMNYGPKFGVGDLTMENDFDKRLNCWNCQYSYEKRIRNKSTFNSNGFSRFSVKEYEIFQISKKP
ncbi:hypothetical protein C2G38_2137128 [Gigaspora rosea]|uniref:TLDc domain-containing protein n=1 Tax=Gigaspora rosea TaxID=44941 RepID=A0A397W275_9GLOM|nr:hypothetical protein C2G38_2137128 [Gigaspora rosea]